MIKDNAKAPLSATNTNGINRDMVRYLDVAKIFFKIGLSLCCLLFGLLSSDVKRDAKNVFRKLTCTNADSSLDDNDANDVDDLAIDQVISSHL